eukprot:jgi/Botrbrau1/18865/Bobra.177_2s0025.1
MYMDQLLGTPSTFGGSGIGSGYVQRARVPTPLGGLGGLGGMWRQSMQGAWGESNMLDSQEFQRGIAEDALVPLDAGLQGTFPPYGYNTRLVSYNPQAFKVLDYCNWEQTDTWVKVYVPLRGVHTDMLQASFSRTSVQVHVRNLQGKNYVFKIAQTYKPIVPNECTAVASKTKKNILVTLQKASTNTIDERRWRDYKAPGVQG